MNAPSKVKVARCALHFWEEPPVSGINGSGTVFFSGCRLHCAFCQNYKISHEGQGVWLTESRFIDELLRLQDLGAHNINLVTPSHVVNFIAAALEKVKGTRLNIPIVYNTSGYDSLENLRRLDGLVDVYLPDFKYSFNSLGEKYSRISDYVDVAKAALFEMRRQQPLDVFETFTSKSTENSPRTDGSQAATDSEIDQSAPSVQRSQTDDVSDDDDEVQLIKRGVIVRHLIIPGEIENSKGVLDILSRFDSSLYVSVMAQYFPPRPMPLENLNRRLTQSEYDEITDYFFSVGLSNGFCQELSSAIEDYTPNWTFH